MSPTQREIDTLLLLYNSNDFDKAIKAAIELTSKYPYFQFGWKVLGAIYRSKGLFHDAITCMKRGLEIDERDPEAHNNLGVTFFDIGQLTAAETSYRQAILLKPDYAEAHNNLGITLHDMGQVIAAEASYRQAIKLKPDYAEAHFNLGNFLKKLGNLTAAETSYRQAILLKPDYAEAHNNLGITLHDMGQVIAAEASYRQAIKLKPDYAEAYSNLLLALNYENSLQTIIKEARHYGEIISNKTIPKFRYSSNSFNSSKLRIGFVSGDFRNHPVGYLIEGIIKQFDQNQFEIIAFPTVSKKDDLTARILPYFQEWIPIFEKTDFEAAEIINSKRIQILIDLSGHTGKNRLPVFSYKPAPLQISWLGYFASTGLEEMDYILGDPYVTPQDEEHHFIEKVKRLEQCYLCFTPPVENINISSLPAFHNQFITFGSFNRLSKIGSEVINTWSTILKSIPNSKLFLKTKQLNDPNIMKDVYKKFASQKITSDRLILEGSSPRIELLRSYNKVDIALDPFPYPGGTTSIEALWMSVPVLSLKGEYFLSHIGETIAHNVNQENWIAQDLNDYIAKAISFSSNLDKLSELRRTLRNRVLSSKLLNAEKFTSNFSKILLDMWAEYCKCNFKSQ